MKLLLALRKLWSSRPPQTWPQVYATITTLLLIFLVAATVIDALRGARP